MRLAKLKEELLEKHLKSCVSVNGEYVPVEKLPALWARNKAKELLKKAGEDT